MKLRRNAHDYMVVQNGQPIMLYKDSIKLLVDLSKERGENAIKTLIRLIDDPAKVETYKELHIRDWNGHPSDVSPARYLLEKLGFIKNGRKGFIYDGVYKPDEQTIANAEREIPETFERAGKEKAPVEYDAEWIISRSDRRIRHKVRELIPMLEELLPKECEFVYYPRNFRIRYRGIQCINPRVGQKQIWLHITHRGWTPGVIINSDTDLNSSEFTSEILERFERTKQRIDSELDAGSR